VRNAAESSYRDYVDLLLSEATRERASLSVDTPILARVTGSSNDGSAFTRLSILGKVRGMVQKFPGFFFSSYPQGARRAPALMRMQDFGTTLLRTRQSLLQAIEQGTALSNADDSGTDIEGAGDSEGDDSSSASNGGSSGDIDERLGAAEVTRQPSNIPGISQFPAFLPSIAVWGASGDAIRVDNGTIITSTERLVAPIPSGRGDLAQPVAPVTNVTAVVDGDRDSLLLWPAGVQDATFSLDMGECPSVSGMQFWVDGTGSPARGITARQYTLSAGASLEGPWDTRGSLTVQPSADGKWHSTQFLPFSARYWRVEASTPLGGGGARATGGGRIFGLAVAELQFRLSTAAVCQADTVLSDDRAVNIPKQRLMIDMPSGSNEAERQQVANALKSILRSETIFVQDTETILESANSAIVGLTIFFNFVAVLALILAFFASWLSFTANVRENARELAVLRALGLTIHQVTRVYVYEALSVVLASFTGGAIVGMLISITLTLQFNLFTEQPFVFIFPTSLFVLTFVLLVTVAVVSAYYPALRIARVRIAQVLKGK
jgi:hypothetical protein